LIIQEALHDPSALVRTSAAIAAGKLGLISFVPDLVSLVDDGETLVNTAAVAVLQSLVTIARDSILAEAGSLSSSEKPHHRKAAASLLASLGDVERLQMLIKDEDPHVRKAAISAIGADGVVASASMLVPSLADEDPNVRITVADVLGHLHDEAAVDALEHALTDEDVWVQSSVLKAIARIEPDRALAIIKRIHAGSEGLLMITSLQILGEIGGTESEQIIRYALQDGDQDVARQAAKSLEQLLATESN
jgi:HEAT repeat protein